MTANETIKAYETAAKYKSLRSKGAKYKVQETRGDGWDTLFCVDSELAAIGYAAMRRGKTYSTVTLRIVDRNGNKTTI